MSRPISADEAEDYRVAEMDYRRSRALPRRATPESDPDPMNGGPDDDDDEPCDDELPFDAPAMASSARCGCGAVADCGDRCAACAADGLV